MKDILTHIETLINQGRYVEARAMAQETLKSSSVLRLQQLFALAVSKSGVPKAAMEFLEPVYKQHPDDQETAGIMGGIYKEIFRKEQDTRYALMSRDTYLKNFVTTRSYYTGINAATMSAIAGQAGRGREIAAEVIQLIGDHPSDFWQQVTLAEAYLLTKERDKALAGYFEAKKMAGADWGKVTTVYNQLWLLSHYVPVPKEILRVFHPPGVVSFIGHMIDHPNRENPRFPPSIEAKVKDAIVGAINTINARIGFCSLACGSDILFAEAIAAVGGEVNIWIPFAKADFIEASVRFAGGSWLERFEALINRFPVTYLTHDAYAGYDDLFSFQNRVIFGSAIIRSVMNHTEPTLLTVLSETDLRQKEGGTRDTISLWPYAGRHININPDNFLSPGTATPPSLKTEEIRRTHPAIDRPVLFAVCADLPGVTSGEQQKVFEEIQKRMDFPILAPVTIDASDVMIISFRSILGAMDLARIILRYMQSQNLTGKLRMSLYASPALLTSEGGRKALAPLPASQLRELHRLIPTGAVYAFARFSSALSLDVSHYSVDYAGIVAVDWYPQPLEIYRINMLDGGKTA
ncbi:MAG: DUF4071 domain-containing protein [Cyclobacteriaceae bacterium]|nr:DUF4071 domain-containing protein [Cyclobacteriaceae bacterium]